MLWSMGSLSDGGRGFFASSNAPKKSDGIFHSRSFVVEKNGSRLLRATPEIRLGISSLTIIVYLSFNIVVKTYVSIELMELMEEAHYPSDGKSIYVEDVDSVCLDLSGFCLKLMRHPEVRAFDQNLVCSSCSARGPGLGDAATEVKK